MNKPPKNFLFIKLIITTCLFFHSHVISSIGGENDIWKFDHRTVFYDIEYVDLKNAVIVANRGQILISHKIYKNLWQIIETENHLLLTSLDFTDPQNGWAAGHGGIILHTADGGHTWKIQRPASDENLPLLDIAFVSPNVGFACGAYDTLLKTTDGGNTWQSMPTDMDNIYNSLWFFDANNGYMAGEFGTVLKTQDGGESWQKIDIGDYEGSFFGITCLSKETILAYGISGKIIRSGDAGKTWETIPTGTKKSLFDASFKGENVVIVGQSGTILKSRDGGLHFSPENDPEMTTFAGVCTHPEGGFVCIGERGKIIRIQ